MASERNYASHALAVVSNASCGVAFDGSDIALAFDEGGKLLPKRMNFGSGNQLTLPLPPLQSRKLRPFLNQRDATQQELASGIQIQFANTGRDIEPRLPL